MRDNEVIVVTIPAGQLFGPNDTILSNLGKTSLKPMLQYLQNPGFYKMLLVMHSDNTGSDAYTLELTRSRVNAVFDWFEDNGTVEFVVPYALGDTDPLVDNNSMVNRKRNRRLEIYLVPDNVMINQAKKGKINIKQIQKQ
jgi:outer membrane protein OmpA-like peptidoglycan-associated protein